ncbi:TPA: hypothetical protein ACH1O5_000825 [Enterobacter roggenkampii]
MEEKEQWFFRGMLTMQPHGSTYRLIHMVKFTIAMMDEPQVKSLSPSWPKTEAERKPLDEVCRFQQSLTALERFFCNKHMQTTVICVASGLSLPRIVS